MVRTRRIFVAVFICVLIGGYYWYSILPATFKVEDVSKSETFKLSNQTKPLNISLRVDGHTDSTFRIHVIEEPSRLTLFDSSFHAKQIDFFCRVDYYAGHGIKILYIPQGAKDGKLSIIAKINSDF
jgi:hypothetical protein